jgi:hypothetical protein
MVLQPYPELVIEVAEISHSDGPLRDRSVDQCAGAVTRLHGAQDRLIECCDRVVPPRPLGGGFSAGGSVVCRFPSRGHGRGSVYQIRGRDQNDVVRDFAKANHITHEVARQYLELRASSLVQETQILGVQLAVHLNLETAEFMQDAIYRNEYGDLPGEIRDAVWEERRRRWWRREGHTYPHRYSRP